MTNFTRTFLGAVLAVAATAATLGVSAGPAMAATTVAIGVGSAELGHEAGRAAVAGRIERAARKACNARPEERRLQVRAADRACVATAMARARTELAARRTAPVQLAAR